MRHPEWVVVGGFAAAMVAAGVLGGRAGPDAALRDPRASLYLPGPDGASALGEALQLMGVVVEGRDIPLFGIGEDLAGEAATTALVVVEPWYEITEAEIRQVGDHLRAGGTLVLVGWTGIEEELGLALRAATDDDEDEPLEVVAPEGIDDLPGVWSVIGRKRPAPGERPPARPARVDTLLAAGRFPVALELEFRGGGRALLVAEPDWIRNRSLRETDVGALVIPWIVALGVDRLVVDEYHQGFGRSGALFQAAGRWLLSAPPGWAMVQLGFAALVALLASAVRFGPAIHALPRRRRSPLEHLDALASGLERAGGVRTAVALLGRGLARRLRRAGRAAFRPPVGARDRERWLAALTRASDDPAARASVARLGWLLREAGEGDEHVLRTAQAVEDVWDALKQPSRHERS